MCSNRLAVENGLEAGDLNTGRSNPPASTAPHRVEVDICTSLSINLHLKSVKVVSDHLEYLSFTQMMHMLGLLYCKALISYRI